MFQDDNMLHTSYYNIKTIKDATLGTWGKNNFPPPKKKKLEVLPYMGYSVYRDVPPEGY